MTPIKYANNLNAKLCKVADVNNKSTLNDNFIEKVDSSICSCFRKY